MNKKQTTLRISEEVWSKLKDLKKLGDSTDDVLRRVLDLPIKNGEEAR
jgi:predicted CopG family antitoxin